MKRINPSYLYFFILAAMSQPGLAYAQSAGTNPPAISAPVSSSGSSVSTSPPSSVPTNGATQLSNSTSTPSAAGASTAAPSQPSGPPAQLPAPASVSNGNAPVAQTPPTNSATNNPGSAPSTPPANPVSPSAPASASSVANTQSNPPSSPANPVAQTSSTNPATTSSSAGNSNPPAAPIVSLTLKQEDLKSGGIKLSFNGLNAQLNGNLPQVCADLLAMDVPPPLDAEEDADEVSAPENTTDIDKIAIKVGVKVIFKGSAKYKTLSECRKGENGNPTVALSAIDRLSKPALENAKQVARLGLMNDEGKIELGDKAILSAAYVKLEKVLKFKDCTDCSVSEKKVKGAIDDVEGQSAFANSLREALLEKGLDAINDEIAKSHSLGNIESIRSELVAYYHIADDLKSDSTSRDDALGKVQSAFQALQKQTYNMAYQDAAHADRYADMIAKTGAVIGGTKLKNGGTAGGLKGLDSKFRDDESAHATDFAKGGSERLNYISSIDPGHIEVREKLNGGAQELHAAQLEVNKNCKTTLFNRNRINTDACQQSILAMKTIQTEVEGLATKLQASQQLPDTLAPTQQNSLGMSLNPQANAAIKGYFPFGNGSINEATSNQMNQQVAANNIFGLPGFMQANGGMYQPTTQSMFGVTGLNYQARAGSGFQAPAGVTSQATVAVPINPSLLPNQNSNSNPTPNYEMAFNG